MQKTDDNVSDLDAGVVDVVLDFDAIAGGLQDAYERVAENGVADVTDVRGFVWVDAGVLNHFFGLIRFPFGLPTALRRKKLEQLRAIKKDIDITRARNLNPRNFFNTFQLTL
jgi:hypothetical protein